MQRFLMSNNQRSLYSVCSSENCEHMITPKWSPVSAAMEITWRRRDTYLPVWERAQAIVSSGNVRSIWVFLMTRTMHNARFYLSNWASPLLTWKTAQRFKLTGKLSLFPYRFHVLKCAFSALLLKCINLICADIKIYFQSVTLCLEPLLTGKTIDKW